MQVRSSHLLAPVLPLTARCRDKVLIDGVPVRSLHHDATPRWAKNLTTLVGTLRVWHLWLERRAAEEASMGQHYNRQQMRTSGGRLLLSVRSWVSKAGRSSCGNSPPTDHAKQYRKTLS